MAILNKRKHILSFFISATLLIFMSPQICNIIMARNLMYDLTAIILTLIVPFFIFIFGISEIVINIIINFILNALNAYKNTFFYVEKSIFTIKIFRIISRLVWLLLAIIVVIFTYIMSIQALGMLVLCGGMFIITSFLFFDNKILFINGDCYAFNIIRKRFQHIAFYQIYGELIKLYFDNDDEIIINSGSNEKMQIITHLENCQVKKR